MKRIDSSKKQRKLILFGLGLILCVVCLAISYSMANFTIENEGTTNLINAVVGTDTIVLP